MSTDRWITEDPSHLPAAELKLLAEQILADQEQLDWNAINLYRFGREKNTPVAEPPKYPNPPKPYRSWHEYWLFTQTPLKNTSFEPKTHRLNYTISHTYQPDAVSPSNDRVMFEAKGIIQSLEEARKYIHIREQNDVVIVFILQLPNIQLPWNKPRKDGTRRTMEEWLMRNRFPYCYRTNLSEFLGSNYYRSLLKSNNNKW